MKNIYTLSSGRIDRPHLILSLFFLVVFLTGPFSESYLDLHPISSHVNQYYENQKGSYSLFITLYDSATGKHINTPDKFSVGKPGQTDRVDTCYSFPPQKSNLNVVVW